MIGIRRLFPLRPNRRAGVSFQGPASPLVPSHVTMRWTAFPPAVLWRSDRVQVRLGPRANLFLRELGAFRGLGLV